MVLGARPLDNLSSGLRFEWFATATIGMSLRAPHLHRAVVDVNGSMEQIAERLRMWAAKRIGLVARRIHGTRISHPWLGAWAMAAESWRDREWLPPLVLEENEQKRIRPWLRANRPDAVLTMWVRKWPGVLRRKGGPRLIDLVDNRETGLPGPLQSSELIGSAAVDLVVQQLQRNVRGLPSPRHTTLVEAGWQDAEM